MGEYLSFDKLITPALVRIVFWLGLAGVLFNALALMFSGSFWTGLGILILGPFVVRIWCEIMIVIFQINNTLTEIRDNQNRINPPTPTLVP